MTFPDFSIYNAIGAPIFVLTENEKGDIVYAFLNASGCRKLLCAPSDVVGKTAAELFPGRVSGAAYRRQQEAWARGVDARYEIAVPLGEDVLWMVTHLTPHHAPDGSLAYMVGISLDITREKQLEQAHAMTTAMTSEMEDLVSLAAHDLRSPIANVKMLADLVRDGFVDMGDGKLEMIQMIEDICEQSLTLVSDVLAHATASRTDVQPRRFGFRQLCEDILTTLDPARQHLAELTDSEIEADFTAVQIIIRNLIDNAVKHAGLGQIELRLDVSETDNGMLRFVVCDNGKGFDDPTLAFIEGKESRVESGFGLLGVRRLVLSRGGQITAVPPDTGRGAQICVTLPGRVVQESVAAAG